MEKYYQGMDRYYQKAEKYYQRYMALCGGARKKPHPPVYLTRCRCGRMTETSRLKCQCQIERLSQAETDLRQAFPRDASGWYQVIDFLAPILETAVMTDLNPTYTKNLQFYYRAEPPGMDLICDSLRLMRSKLGDHLNIYRDDSLGLITENSGSIQQLFSDQARNLNYQAEREQVNRKIKTLEGQLKEREGKILKDSERYQLLSRELQKIDQQLQSEGFQSLDQEGQEDVLANKDRIWDRRARESHQLLQGDDDTDHGYHRLEGVLKTLMRERRQIKSRLPKTTEQLETETPERERYDKQVQSALASLLEKFRTISDSLGDSLLNSVANLGEASAEDQVSGRSRLISNYTPETYEMSPREAALMEIERGNLQNDQESSEEAWLRYNGGDYIKQVPVRTIVPVGRRNFAVFLQECHDEELPPIGEGDTDDDQGEDAHREREANQERDWWVHRFINPNSRYRGDYPNQLEKVWIYHDYTPSEQPPCYTLKKK